MGLNEWNAEWNAAVSTSPNGQKNWENGIEANSAFGKFLVLYRSVPQWQILMSPIASVVADRLHPEIWRKIYLSMDGHEQKQKASICFGTHPGLLDWKVFPAVLFYLPFAHRHRHEAHLQ